MADKRLERLQARPKDYTWGELTSLLASHGYKVKNGKGSRRRFMDDQKNKINLHEPHPGNIVKAYVIDDVINLLEEHGKI